MNWGHWADLWGRASPTSFSSTLWYPHFLFLTTINSWPRAGGLLSTPLPPPPLSASANTPVGKSRQSPVSSHCTQVYRNSQPPASITSSWHQSQPPPGSPELPPQESPPMPPRRKGYKEEGVRISQPLRGSKSHPLTNCQGPTQVSQAS